MKEELEVRSQEVLEGEEQIQYLAKNRGMFLTFEQMRHIPATSLLPPGRVEILNKLRMVYESGCRTGLGGSFIGDVTQSTGRLRNGPWLPTVARSSLLYCFSDK